MGPSEVPPASLGSAWPMSPRSARHEPSSSPADTSSTGMSVAVDDGASPSDEDAVERRTTVRSWCESRLRSANVSVLEAVLGSFFAWSAWRNKWLSDDGYIYLAYVRNLTENGWGPVFNQGERVEGFTSAAWFALLSTVNVIRPDRVLDLRQAVLLVSLGLAIAAIALWVRVESLATRFGTRQPVDAEPAEPVEADARDDFVRRQTRLNIPMAAMAAWYPLHSFATSGLETPLQLLTLMFVIVYVWSDKDRDWMVGTLAGVLPLVRPELGLVSVLLVSRHAVRVRSRRSVTTVLALFVAPLVVALVVRVHLYGQLLPNTFYTKTETGHGVRSGLSYLRDTSIAYGLHWVAAAALLVVIVPAVAGRGPTLRAVHGPRPWFLGTAIAMTVYAVVVGGDFMHARFLLSSVLFLFAVFSGLGSDAISRIDTDVQRRVALATVATVIVFTAASTTEPVQRTLNPAGAERAVVLGDISDEQLSYFHRNRALHDWNPSTVDPWTRRGEVVRELSELLGTEIGLTSGGIGHLAFAGQDDRGMVYVYDVLGLTRPDVARLDMQGPLRRVGHAKEAPDVLVAANPRVDFHAPYFRGWKNVATIRFGDEPLVLTNLDLIDPLVEAGVMSAADAADFRAWLLARLNAPNVDRNLVTFLTMRYHRDDEVAARVEELADLDRTSAWRTWLDATASPRELLDTAGCRGLDTLDCWGRAVDRHVVDGIPAPLDEPDIVEVDAG